MLKINDQIKHPVKGIGTITKVDKKPVYDRFGDLQPGVYTMLIEYKDWPHTEGKKEILHSDYLDRVEIIEK